MRTADIDENRKETQLQRLNDQLTLRDHPNAEELEQCIEELTKFKPGIEVGPQS